MDEMIISAEHEEWLVRMVRENPLPERVRELYGFAKRAVDACGGTLRMENMTNIVVTYRAEQSARKTTLNLGVTSGAS